MFKYRLKVSIFLRLLVAVCIYTSCSNKKTMSENTAYEKDVHSFAKPEEAVMTHLNLELDVNFNKKELKGVAHITFKASDKAKEIVLDTRGLKIEKVTLGKDEQKADFSLGEEKPHLGRPLSVTITPSTDLLHVYYAADSSAEAVQWLRPEQTEGKKHPFLFTQSQAILARTWIPLQDSPGIRFTYEATVKVPKDMLALMSAENPKEKNDKGVYTFRNKQPVPGYLMALAVGDLAFKPTGERTGVYAEPSLVEKAAYEFADTEKMLEAAEALYGPYRWGRYDLLVLPPSFPFGGMENPCLTFATPTVIAGDRSLTSLIAHELAHSWSGNLVTNATWNDFWLNEGFTVYFERRIMEKLYGRDYEEMLAVLGRKDLQETVDELIREGKKQDTRLKLDLKDRNPDDGMNDIAYEKGYLFLRMLEENVGRQKFDAFLKKYFEENAFRPMTTEKFRAYLEEHLVKQTDQKTHSEPVIKQWLYEEGIPDNAPVIKSEKLSAVGRLTEEGKNSFAKPDFKAWAETAARGADRRSAHEWLYFLRNLPEKMPQQDMQVLDDKFRFTQSGNKEILGVWLVHAVRNRYKPADAALEEFLIRTGRRKLIVPIYKELMKTPEGKAEALRIYAKARPGYHAVAVNTLDEITGFGK